MCSLDRGVGSPTMTLRCVRLVRHLSPILWRSAAGGEAHEIGLTSNAGGEDVLQVLRSCRDDAERGRRFPPSTPGNEISA